MALFKKIGRGIEKGLDKISSSLELDSLKEERKKVSNKIKKDKEENDVYNKQKKRLDFLQSLENKNKNILNYLLKNKDDILDDYELITNNYKNINLYLHDEQKKIKLNENSMTNEKMEIELRKNTRKLEEINRKINEIRNSRKK